MWQFKVFLEGGPSSFPDDARVQFTTSLTEKIKHRFGSGYEHFRHEGDFTTVNGEKLAVFHWTDRTAIAE
ncbi:DUF5988 family protein [Streptomyces triticirhizae]|uniref:Uncharacterized protein n=1 Tax=Streptomyces triticirhizae TaxID=2483353 RepID=A0A3M2L4Y6_9ACTN|nr:DUF5988 family protein [Streptomyces triticirhizae]RMI32444.1 hypothetical protein EBN88_25185 [Streptomyces triticirhizae]